MDKITVVNVVLGSVGVITGITGTIIGCVNSRSIKKMAPLESRMTAVESNINALLNPATVVAAAAPAAPAPAAQPQQQGEAKQSA
jgi:outer membrane murein-binding lipoprotein Lpp